MATVSSFLASMSTTVRDLVASGKAVHVTNETAPELDLLAELPWKDCAVSNSRVVSTCSGTNGETGTGVAVMEKLKGSTLPCPVGEVFNYWTVLGRVYRPEMKKPCRWQCRCVCGAVRDLYPANVRAGKTQSCGCQTSQLLRTKCPRTMHGGAKDGLRMPEYEVWAGMIKRCHSPTSKSYRNYGGRGIRVSSEWRADFATFLKDMGARPSNRHSIERINNDGPYCAENCRWATMAEQSRNKRTTVRISLHGQTLTFEELECQYGIKHGTLRTRWRNGLRGDDLVAPVPRYRLELEAM